MNLLMNNMGQFIDKVNNDINDGLRQLFKDWIKGSFLIKVKEQIVKNEKFFDLFRDYYYPVNQSNLLTGISLNDNIYIDICKYIINVHSYNCCLLDDYARRRKENSETYIRELIKEVYQMVYLKPYSNSIKDVKNLAPYEPVNYYTFVACTRINEILLSLKDYDAIILLQSKLIIRNIQAIGLLVENDDYISAMSLLRPLYESIITYLLLDKSDVNLYITFQEWNYQYEMDNDYPDDFLQYYVKKTIMLKNKPDKVNFLRYGWITEKQKKTMKPDIKYTFRDVVNLLNNKSKKSIGDRLYKGYTRCCSFIHNNYTFHLVNAKGNEVFWLKNELLYLLLLMIDKINILYKIDKKLFDDIDMYKTLEDLKKDSKNKYDNYDKIRIIKQPN